MCHTQRPIHDKEVATNKKHKYVNSLEVATNKIYTSIRSCNCAYKFFGLVLNAIFFFYSILLSKVW